MPAKYRFNTTALRIAQTFDLNDVCEYAQDLEDGQIYMIKAAGAGHATMAQLTKNDVGSIPILLNCLREVDANGDVSNIAANGGLLASDTTPILRGAASEVQEVAWAAGNSDIVAEDFALGADFDGRRDVFVDLFVLTDNAGGGGIEAGTFTVESSWDGGTLVVDTATDTTPAVTIHTITATIAAADVPDSPKTLTLILTLGTHANDPVILRGGRIRHSR